MSKQRAVGEPGTLHHTFENKLIALARPIYASAEVGDYSACTFIFIRS